MFGYVTLDQKTLSPEDSRRYHAYRRALAQALRQRHGPMAQMALSHDCLLYTSGPAHLHTKYDPLL